MKRLLLRPRAASDIDEHIERIAEDNPEAALAVLEHLEAALKRIGEHWRAARSGKPALR